MSTNRTTAILAIVVVVILALLAGFTVRFAQAERGQQQFVDHTYQVIISLRVFLSTVEEAEAGQRGFIIAHTKQFLDRYDTARAAAPQALEHFRRLATDNPRQEARAKEMQRLLAFRLDSLAKTLVLSQAPHNVPLEFLQVGGAGRVAMEQLRGVVDAAIADENALLRQRQAATRASEWLTVTTLMAAAIFALIVLIAGAHLLTRSNTRLAHLQSLSAYQANILQATLDSIREGIAVFERDGSLAAFNLNFFHLLELPPGLAKPGTQLEEIREAGGESLGAVLPPDASAPMTELGYQRLVAAQRELDVYRTPVADDGFLIAAIDVTARVRAEASLRQAQKMEAVGHLTGGVAHDFNNLLQIISANLDLVAKDVRGQPQTAVRVQNAISALERGSRLTGQLLAFARRQALDPRSINVGRLIRDMTELMRRTLGERIEVEAVIGGGLWNTMIDPGQIENAMINLAINARDAMPDGGKLTIEVANAFLDDNYAIEQPDVTPGQYVMVAVSDTGEGMAPDVAARAFDPFFTTKGEGRGTGLGLSQVYGFVKQSGGHIKIYTEPGHGTTVKLYLPRSRKTQERSDPVARTPAEGGSETVLVVEDDEDVRAAVVDMLSELGYSVLRAENAERALEVLGSGVPIHILFSDVVMPGPVSTREMARRARELQPNIAVLFTSGYTQNAIVHNGRLDEDVFLLSKPYRKDDLARKLRQVLKATDTAAPASAPSSAPAETSPAKAPARPKPRKVLVVEDIGLIRMSTVDMLTELGFATVEAGRGDEALALIEKDAGIDVLFADLGLPDMDGFALLTEALRLRPGLAVVIVSGATPATVREKAPPGAQFVQKPFEREQLARAFAAL